MSNKYQNQTTNFKKDEQQISKPNSNFKNDEQQISSSKPLLQH